jgi:hypothetical protein
LPIFWLSVLSLQAVFISPKEFRHDNRRQLLPDTACLTST